MKSLLPHFYAGHSTFSINFRLSDSLPQSVIKELKDKLKKDIENIENIKEYNEDKKLIKIAQLRLNYFMHFEHMLDNKQYGECVLRDPKIAQILYNKILSYSGVHYDLKCLNIMPNHVHLLLSTITIDENPPVNKWMHLIKGGSSFLINKTLNRRGRLWAVESFDRYIRDEIHYNSAFNYCVNNPIKAGLGSEFSEKPYAYRCDMDE